MTDLDRASSRPSTAGRPARGNPSGRRRGHAPGRAHGDASAPAHAPVHGRLTRQERLAAVRLVDAPALHAAAPDVAARVARQAQARQARSPRLWGHRLMASWLLHRASLAPLFGLLTVAAWLHGVNATASPAPNDDEATYVSQALVFAQHGELSHYTYWYDHPPLGWILLAGWNQVARLLTGSDDVWTMGRWAMLAVHLVSVALVFVVARRLGARRWAATVAGLLFTLSPLGLAWQRLVLLDNIGTPLLLGAWALALSRRRGLAAYLGSAVLLAAAVMVKETNALFAPALLATLWLAGRATRRYAVATFATLLGCLVGAYPLYAVLKHELIPGDGHVSLAWAIWFQLIGRPGSGSPWVAGTGANLALREWFSQDWPLLVGGLAATVFVLVRVRPGRPLAATLLLLMLMPLRGGYLPAPYPINLVWPAALVVALAVDDIARLLGRQLAASRREGAGTSRRLRHAVPAACLSAAGIAALGFVGGRAVLQDLPYLSIDQVSDYRHAREWLLAHTTERDVVLCDNTTWLDLVLAGRPRDNTVWFSKLTADPAVLKIHPGGWRDMTYVVETGIIDATRGENPPVAEAIAHGQEVASYGGVRILEVHPESAPRR